MNLRGRLFSPGARCKRSILRVILFLLTIILIGCPGGDGGGGGDDSSDSDSTPPYQRDGVIADAGFDLTAKVTRNFLSPQPGDIVFLSADASGGNEFSWSVVNQSAPGNYKLTSPSTRTTGFYADVAGDFTIRLLVGDGQGQTDEDVVNITVIEDMDADGLLDAFDPDRDGDGFSDNEDLFPDDKSAHYDQDGDGTSNYDTDDVDQDGTPDVADDFPLDPLASAFANYVESKETVSDNQNDGITVSEDAGTVPKRITGVISASTRPDLDYYQITFDGGGRYSVVLTGAVAVMQPAIAVIDANGDALSSTTANMPLAAGNTAISILVPQAGDYYLSVTDSSGTSDPGWGYQAELFPDGDLDGISDELEKAIDCNHLTADSDGDGISDFIEITNALSDWAQLKDGDADGVPTWWDLDSDGDSIADAVEFYTVDNRPQWATAVLARNNDADSDLVPNYLDVDSDGNGLSDDTEAGPNLNAPTDTDGDELPDFADLDDDDDGLLDVNEQEGYLQEALLPADNQSANEVGNFMRIDGLVNNTLGVYGLARAGDDLVIVGYDLPAVGAETWIVVRGTTGSININPTGSVELGLAFTWPIGIEPGLVELFVASDNHKTNAVEVLVPAAGAPLLSGYTQDPAAGTVTFSGLNLDAALSVHFSGASTTLDNSFGSATGFTVDIPYGAERGLAYVNSAGGDSNTLWVDLARSIGGSVVLPFNSGVDVTTLDVSWSPFAGEEVYPDAQGLFTTTGDRSGPTIVTALIEDTAASEPTFAVFLQAVALPSDATVVLSSASTAVALIWNGIGVSGLVSASDLAGARSLLADLDEVKALGSLLETKLAVDPFVLNGGDTEIQSQAEDALLSAADTIAAALAQGTLTTADVSAAMLTPLSLFSEPAEVRPGEVDDIKVEEYGDQGNIQVENDTQLYLSVKITGTDGTLLQPHITGLRGMAGPQGFGLLFWAATSPQQQPKGRNCIVQVLTPGIDQDYDPQIAGDFNVRKWLFMRTIIERAIWPPIASIISIKIDPGDLASIIMNNALGMPAIMDDFVQGNIWDGTKGVLNALWTDVASLPPGPITKAIAVRVGKDFATEALAKLAAKIGANFVPGLGQIKLAYDIAGHINNGVNATKALADLSSVDSAIEFSVEFPLSITEVVPGKVRADGKDKVFIVKGSGFSKVVRGLIFKRTLTPEVTFTDADGNEYPVSPSYIKPDGTQMTVKMSGFWLDEYTRGPIRVTVHHPKDEPGSQVTKDPAVFIVSDVEIASISPDQGGSGTAATIYGAGFSSIISDNEVMVGSSTALISAAGESTIGIVIPNGLEPGEYDVKARSRHDGDWSDWSNTVIYTVVEGDVKITVTDNGGLKDDAFALYVDGRYVGTMYASGSSYTSVYDMSLSPGSHTAMLLGVEAPDSVGTYGISFSGVSDVSGDATSGSDLVPGVRKYYTITVGAESAASFVGGIKPMPHNPKVLDEESAYLIKISK